jgi:hypothetical protein
MISVTFSLQVETSTAPERVACHGLILFLTDDRHLVAPGYGNGSRDVSPPISRHS